MDTRSTSPERPSLRPRSAATFAAVAEETAAVRAEAEDALVRALRAEIGRLRSALAAARGGR